MVVASSGGVKIPGYPCTKALQLEKNAARSKVLELNRAGKLDQYQHLVFACHGVLPEEVTRVDQPALVLSDPDPMSGKDGFLTMADVFALSLNADLVALSACNTGGGKAARGQGIRGLTRAFMYAGTPTITVTLWSVETHSAKALNVGFFKYLKEGRSRAQALRQIKLDMLHGKHEQQWHEPYYWAPMVMFGQGG